MLKVAFAARGLPVGGVRPPLLDVNGAVVDEIRDTLRRLGKI
jgi:hypothetical protein